MSKSYLIKKEVRNYSNSLPLFYTKVQYIEEGDKLIYDKSSSFFAQSQRHQTNQLQSKRFYKLISIFNI